MPRPLYIAITIAADLDRLWRFTQAPDIHERWDLRFSTIEYLPRTDESSPQRFRYATRIGFGLTVEGWGESIADRAGEAAHTSSLRFGSDSPISLISEGAGYWKYTPQPGAIDFETGYDYRTRFGPTGRLIDALVFRPLIGWATAWSFDRLRLWLEHGIDPTLSAVRSLTNALARLSLAAVFAWHGLVPKLIASHPDERRLIEGAGVPANLAPHALTLAGILEVLYAIAIITLWRARWIFPLTAALLCALIVPALIADPNLLSHPFTPITLTVAMLGLCSVGWFACRDLPSASRCRRKRQRGETTG